MFGRKPVAYEALIAEITRLSEVNGGCHRDIARLADEYDAALRRIMVLAADTREANERIVDLEAELVAARALKATPEPLSAEARETLLKSVCAHCGGVHSRACPRVKRMAFRADGTTPSEVEFWRDNEWPHDGVAWIEDIAAAPEVMERTG